MNSLSWLIYLANVAGTLSGFLVFICVVFGLVTIVCFIAGLVHLEESPNRYPLEGEDLETYRKCRKTLFKASGFFFVLLFLFGVTAAVIPDRQTVLLIAASEIGEQVVTHQRVQGVIDPSIDLLQTWIRQQTQTIQQQMNSSRR